MADIGASGRLELPSAATAACCYCCREIQVAGVGAAAAAAHSALSFAYIYFLGLGKLHASRSMQCTEVIWVLVNPKHCGLFGQLRHGGLFRWRENSLQFFYTRN